MKKILKTFAIIGSFLLISATCFAYSGDISINSSNIKFSSNNFIEGREVRIYATVSNNSDQDLLGVVRFFDNDSQISGDQAISLFGKKTDDVFVDWTPSFGSHRIAVKIYPWDPSIDDPSNNWIVTEVYAVQDTDRDGIPNTSDPDDDGDGINDNEDAFPLNSNEQYDTDGDGIGNNADSDDDNDGVPDKMDGMPLDPNETMDTDNDGIGNISDLDDDNDGISDIEEEKIKTDPLKTDTDGDNVNDKEDAFPLDPNEWLDTDKDNIGNNADPDDDNDKIKDEEDKFPLNKAPIIELKDEDTTIGLMESDTFDASPSYDEDGEIVSYLWKINDKIIKEGNSFTHTFTSPGKYNIQLTVIDNSGEIQTKDFQINVLNLRLYKQISLTLITIFLALAIFFKYIAKAKKSKKDEIQSI